MGSTQSQETVDEMSCSQCKSNIIEDACISLSCKHLLCPTCSNDIPVITNSEQCGNIPTPENDEPRNEENRPPKYKFAKHCPVCGELKEITNLQKTVQLYYDMDEMCPRHEGYPIKLHCTECMKAICYECYAHDHDGHRKEDIAMAMKQLHPRLRSHLDSLSLMQIFRQNRLNQVTKTMKDLSLKYEDVQKAAEAETEMKVKTLKANLLAFKEKTNDDRDLVLRELGSEKEVLEKSVTDMDGLLPWKQFPFPNENQHGSKVFCAIQNEILPKAVDLGDEIQNSSTRCPIKAVEFPEFHASELDLRSSAGHIKMVKGSKFSTGEKENVTGLVPKSSPGNQLI